MLTAAWAVMLARLGRSTCVARVSGGGWRDDRSNNADLGMTGTYNGDIKHGHIATDSGWTYGGYSGSQTVHQK